MMEQNNPFADRERGDILHRLITNIEEMCRMMGEPPIFGNNPDTSLKRKARKERARMLTRQRMKELRQAPKNAIDAKKQGKENQK